MKAYELIEILKRKPQADVVVMPDEQYQNKFTFLTPYVDDEGNVVIQFWGSDEV